MSNFGLVSLKGSLPSSHSRELLRGTDGMITSQTISRMRDMVTLGKREFEIRKLVGQLVATCPPKNYYCYAQAAHEFCRDKIRYVFDPSGVELIENPARILESKVADCDSIVILMASLCENMGFPCRFVTIKADRKRPDSFTHVFLEVKIPHRGWVGSDPTQPERPFGWEPGPEYPRKVWAASKDAPEDARESDEMAGFGYLGGPIPGVQDTPGVIVEKPWEFRDEPALVVTNPEQIELSAMLPKKQQAVPEAPRSDYFTAEQIENITFVPDNYDAPDSTETPMKMEVLPKKAMSGFGAMPTVSPWLLLGGVALGLYLLGKRK